MAGRSRRSMGSTGVAGAAARPERAGSFLVVHQATNSPQVPGNEDDPSFPTGEGGWTVGVTNLLMGANGWEGNGNQSANMP